MKFLKKLCEADGVSGHEDAIVEMLKEELAEHLDSIKVDAMKNFIGLKKGTVGRKRKKVMLAGHIDEIGFLVYNISEQGYASVVPLGGWATPSIAGHTVRVHTRKGETLTAVMQTPAVIEPEAAKKVPVLHTLYLDFGLDGKTVKEKVSRGDRVCMDTSFRKLGDCYVAKAFDDRVGAYIIAEAVKKYRNPKIDVYCVGTAQEEVGLRGSTVAAQTIKPDIGIAVDITFAGDSPGYSTTLKMADLGKGVTIKQMDGSVISSTSLVEFVRGIAEKKKIDHQMEILMRGGTDTSSMQKFSPGAHSTCLSIPTRYGHSPVAVIHKHDVETAIELLVAFLNKAHLFSN